MSSLLVLRAATPSACQPRLGLILSLGKKGATQLLKFRGKILVLFKEPVHSLPAEFPRRVQKFTFLPTATRAEAESNHIEAALIAKGRPVPRKI